MDAARFACFLRIGINTGFALIIIRRIISLQMFGIGLVEVLAKIKEKQQN